MWHSQRCFRNGTLISLLYVSPFLYILYYVLGGAVLSLNYLKTSPGNDNGPRPLWLGLSLTTRGLFQVQMQVETHFVTDVLRGNDTTEMKITLLRYIDDEMPPDDE